jgi:hypothetical protein
VARFACEGSAVCDTARFLTGCETVGGLGVWFSACAVATIAPNATRAAHRHHKLTHCCLPVGLLIVTHCSTQPTSVAFRRLNSLLVSGENGQQTRFTDPLGSFGPLGHMGCAGRSVGRWRSKGAKGCQERLRLDRRCDLWQEINFRYSAASKPL